MHFTTILFTVLGSLSFRFVTATASYLHTRDASNITTYGVWLNPINSTILRFESTLIMTGASYNGSALGHMQAIWPGLETTDYTALLQNVLSNQAVAPGEWLQLPYYCCHPAGPLINDELRLKVFEGDAVTNSFSFGSDGNWFNNWVVTPGKHSNQAAYGGGFVFNPEYDHTTKGAPFTHVIMSIELQGLGKWDFGPVEWKNIIVEANTTESKWCSNGPVGDKTLSFVYTTPTWHTMGTTTTCYIAHMIFEHPNAPT